MFDKYFTSVTICVEPIGHTTKMLACVTRFNEMLCREGVNCRWFLGMDFWAAEKWMEKSAKSRRRHRRGHRAWPYVVVSRLQTLVHCSFSVRVLRLAKRSHSKRILLGILCWITHTHTRPWQLGVPFQFYLYFWCWKLLTTYLSIWHGMETIEARAFLGQVRILCVLCVAYASIVGNNVYAIMRGLHDLNLGKFIMYRCPDVRGSYIYLFFAFVCACPALVQCQRYA